MCPLKFIKLYFIFRKCQEETKKKIIMENSRAKNFVGSSCDRISGGWIIRWPEIVNREPARFFNIGRINTDNSILIK